MFTGLFTVLKKVKYYKCDEGAGRYSGMKDNYQTAKKSRSGNMMKGGFVRGLERAQQGSLAFEN